MSRVKEAIINEPIVLPNTIYKKEGNWYIFDNKSKKLGPFISDLAAMKTMLRINTCKKDNKNV